jgi:hypothetical protein
MSASWHPWQAGDIAWVAVTDHPNFSKVAYPDTCGKCRTQEECQKLCDAWNSYGGEWTWYPKEFVLQDGREHKDDDDSQLVLL